MPYASSPVAVDSINSCPSTLTYWECETAVSKRPFVRYSVRHLGTQYARNVLYSSSAADELPILTRWFFKIIWSARAAFHAFLDVLSRPVRSSCISVWPFPNCLHHFLTFALAVRHYLTCTTLPVCPEFQWGRGHVSSIRNDPLHELPRGTVVIAIAHQLIPCMASHWILRYLLHVTPTTSATSSRRTKHFIDTKVVQQGNLLMNIPGTL